MNEKQEQDYFSAIDKILRSNLLTTAEIFALGLSHGQGERMNQDSDEWETRWRKMTQKQEQIRPQVIAQDSASTFRLLHVHAVLKNARHMLVELWNVIGQPFFLLIDRNSDGEVDSAQHLTVTEATVWLKERGKEMLLEK